MINKVVLVVLFLCVSQVFSVPSRDLKDKLHDKVNRIRNKVNFLQNKPNQEQPLPTLPTFTCQAPSSVPPATSVHQLRPGNIKAIMAAGDSITAGFAMESTNFNLLKVKQNLIEYRPYVFSIGANTSYSLANYFKTYNPSLVGGSTGTTVPIANKEDYMDVVTPPAAESILNAGESGAVVSDIRGEVDYLLNELNTLESQGKLSVANDWKLLTLLIGANNLCTACSDEDRSSPVNYEANLRDALTYMQSKIPRVFVSIITMFNLSTVYNTFQTSSYCVNIRKTVFDSECACIAKDYSPAGLQKVDEYAQKYNEIIFKVASEFQDDDTFTVKVQPCTQNFVIPPAIGTQFLSQYDCFHPSLFANQAISISLWNNLFTPQAQKQTTIDPFQEEFVCPDSDTFLQ